MFVEYELASLMSALIVSLFCLPVYLLLHIVLLLFVFFAGAVAVAYLVVLGAARRPDRPIRLSVTDSLPDINM